MADVDIGEELLRAVRRDFRQELGDKDSKLAKILKRIQDGKGTFHDVALFSKECGAALSEAIAKNVTPDRLPDGQLYYNIADTILRATLKDNYDLVNMVAQAAQEQTDSKLNIHLAPQQAPFPEDRIHKIINGAADQTADSDTIKRRLDSPVRNVTESFYDDFVEENAEFRDEAGLKTHLVRQTNGKCCDWCASLAGRYLYEDAPEEVFSKHDNCTCTVEYITDKYRENVHTKKRYALSQRERSEILKNTPKPTRFTKEQAQNLQLQVLNGVANSGGSGIMEIVGDVHLLQSAMSPQDYKNFMDLVRNNSNNGIRILYNRYADKLNGVTLISNNSGKAHYDPNDKKVYFRYQTPTEIANGRSQFSTLAHEYGHAFERVANFSGIHFKEIDTLNSATNCSAYGFQLFKRTPSSSDEFLEAMRKDRDNLKVALKASPDVRKDLLSSDASVGVQDAICGMFSGMYGNSRTGMRWGHKDDYYDRKYFSAKRLGESKQLKSAYLSLGLDASNQAKVKSICRNYETTSELWANISSAVVCGGKELDYVKKYLPNSYNAYLEILKGVQ